MPDAALAAFLRTCQTALAHHPLAGRVALLAAAAQRQLNSPIPLYQLAATCWRAGRADLREQCVEFAFERPHQTHESMYRRGAEKLRIGDWSGFTDYEARHFRQRSGSHRASCEHWLRWTSQQWDGVEDISNKTLLVADEGGFGDSMQVLCFAPNVISRAKHIVLMYREALLPLVKHNFGQTAQVVPYGIDTAVRFDRFVLSFTLPSLFSGLPRFERMSAPLPVAHGCTSTRPPIRMGLCWASARYRTLTSAVLRQSDRSIPALSLLEPLLSRPGIEWHSLQVGEHAADANSFPCIQQPQSRFTDFAETANFMSTLDYIVTIDTAIAHLAGRLDLPTFVLLPFDHDWRWGFRSTTPWYPSLTLIRHDRPDGWLSAIDDLGDRLDEVVRRCMTPGLGPNPKLSTEVHGTPTDRVP